MLLVVSLHSGFESGEGAVNLFVNGHVNLGRGSPENYDAAAAVLSLEVADVLAELLNHLPAGEALEVVLTFETLSIVVVESSLHRLDSLEFFLDGVDVFLFENLSVDG